MAPTDHGSWYQRYAWLVLQSTPNSANKMGSLSWRTRPTFGTKKCIWENNLILEEKNTIPHLQTKKSTKWNIFSVQNKQPYRVHGHCHFRTTLVGNPPRKTYRWYPDEKPICCILSLAGISITASWPHFYNSAFRSMMQWRIQGLVVIHLSWYTNQTGVRKKFFHVLFPSCLDWSVLIDQLDF